MPITPNPTSILNSRVFEIQLNSQLPITHMIAKMDSDNRFRLHSKLLEVS